ncbi:hypothetical protein Tco_0435954 [Tanacetum coccineum]
MNQVGQWLVHYGNVVWVVYRPWIVSEVLVWEDVTMTEWMTQILGGDSVRYGHEMAFIFQSFTPVRYTLTNVSESGTKNNRTEGRPKIDNLMCMILKVLEDGQKIGNYLQALGVVRLSLAKNVAYNVVNEKTTYGLIKALSNMYEKPIDIKFDDEVQAHVASSLLPESRALQTLCYVQETGHWQKAIQMAEVEQS